MHFEHSRWVRWGGPIFGLLWLWPLVYAFAVSDPSGGEIVAVAAGLVAFSALFLIAVMRAGPVLYAVLPMLAIAVALTLAVDDAFGWLFAWAGSTATVRLDGRTGAKAWAAVTALAAATIALANPEAALFWGITAGVAATTALWLLIGGLMRANEALREARAELAEMAVADERLRFARDLHDILGHSLTVITVKAELAGRLLDTDPTRARAEITDLERLSRDALADVRRAVEGYRDLTLPGELARARAALEAAEIDADLPNTTDEVPSDLRGLFAWAVREGVTNVIRHSHASSCRIALTSTSLEVTDDGDGATADVLGSGLRGLRERAAAVGATVVTRSLSPGFSLSVARP